MMVLVCRTARGPISSKFDQTLGSCEKCGTDFHEEGIYQPSVVECSEVQGYWLRMASQKTYHVRRRKTQG